MIRKLIICLFLLFIIPSICLGKTAIIGFTALTGGGSGALDAVECEDILGDNTNRAVATGDIAIGLTSTKAWYIYRYNSAGTDGENSPDIIVPNDRADCASAGQWELVQSYTTATVDGSNKMTFQNNTTISPTASAFEAYVEGNILKFNQNGTEYTVPLSPTAGQVTFVGPTAARVVTLPDAAVTIPATPIGGTLGVTANVLPKASGTGGVTAQASGITEDGTNVDIGALNLVTTGTIAGATPSTTDNNGMTLSAAQQYGYMHWATGAGTWNLVTAVAGMSFCVYSTTAAAIVINPANADVITLNGTALSAGDSITSASGAGDFICLMSQSSGNWVTLGRSGTWTDTN